ncbi:hypothetical protein C1645_735984 [Glomus cerebriforme]|uniref:F-box domain-containing protein n=1 Tax=Glomus cerebriforme TaxID=658196 RepID=A0A397T3J0_9GLOM|nr:hypothetical protein C1645_735984 [Glomus cerebriforme]
MTRLNVDCLRLIFNELKFNKKFLHTCLLVNREWCHLIVPILWKKYSWDYDHEESEKKLFNTILSYLPSSSRQFLLDNDVKLPSKIFLKPQLFNYISFCKYLEAEIINKIIGMVFDQVDEINTAEYDRKNLLEQEIYKLFISRCKNLKELSWQTFQPLSLFPGASTCFPRLYSLSIDIDCVNSNALYKMSLICKDLNILSIYNYSQDNPGLISLIDAQKNLKNVSISPHIKKESCKELSKALTRKGNTITDLNLESVNIIPPLFLTSLISLKISNSYEYENFGKEIQEFQQYLGNSEFPELQFLDVDELSCFKELAMLIGKTRGNISGVSIYIFDKSAENTGMLIKAIANNCPKIKWLSTYLEPKDFIYVKSLLLNCKNLISVKFDSLNFGVNKNDNIGDELLEILTKFSPKSLIEISISGNWKYSIDAFNRFFESFRGRTLNYFEINNGQDYITEGHKMIVRQYIIEGLIIDSNFI